jgi:hypothetical protein
MIESLANPRRSVILLLILGVGLIWVRPASADTPAAVPDPPPVEAHKQRATTILVPISIGAGFACGLTGIILSTQAVTQYTSGTITNDTLITNTGIGLGLTIGGAIFLILGVSGGNGDMDYKQVPPGSAAVKPAFSEGLAGVKIYFGP